jgi:hypothetical protein
VKRVSLGYSDRMRKLLTFVSLAFVVTLGCSGDKSSSSGSSAAQSTAPKPTIDLAAIQADVPAALKDKLVFEEREIVSKMGSKEEVYTMAAPKSWKPGDMGMFAKLKPDSADGFGNFTELHLSSNCDGACVAKDWAEVSEKVNFAQFRKDDFKVVKDEKSATDHLMVATSKDGKTTYVTYAWWTEGKSPYFTCRATLEQGFSDGADPRGAAPAFERACKAVGFDERRAP